MAECATTPISWLRLERYHGGDLEEGERAAITAHVDAGPACADCLRRIAEDTRALAPLPSARGGRLLRLAPVLGAVLVAAGVLLLVRDRPAPSTEHLGAGRGEPGARIKGNDITFSLVREEEGLVVEAGGSYKDGERMKALVTCPPGMRAGFDLVVFERGEAVFPLAPEADASCGNAVALPGAFRLTGHARMTVCLVWNDDAPVDRDEVRRLSPDALPHALCKVLEPAP
jgi:hypothetical protein